MKTYALDISRVARTGALFSIEMNKDPLVYFHGTSSCAENEIDGSGIAWQSCVAAREDILDLCSVFQAMNWNGTDGGGGFPILSAFSLAGDFQGKDAKPSYFHENDLRCVTYATRDFAGGESARGVRRAIADLEKYLDDPLVRLKHLDDQRSVCKRLLQNNAMPSRVMSVSDLWLGEQISRFRLLQDRSTRPYADHSHGIIYAARINPARDRSNYSSSMGLRVYTPILASSLVAKMQVPEDSVADLINLQSCKAYLELTPLDKHKEAGIPKASQQNDFASSNCPNYLTTVPVDIGQDEALYLAREYGTPEIVARLREDPHLRTSFMLGQVLPS